jgi:hypothetical protein
VPNGRRVIGLIAEPQQARDDPQASTERVENGRVAP